MSPGLLVVLSGPSGAGKGTLIESLVKKIPGLMFSVSATTRAPRKGEKEGVHYHFTSRQEFEKKIQRKEFLEWAVVHGEYYGTPRDVIETGRQKGNDFILDLDVQGGAQVKKQIPEAVLIFLIPPGFSELRHRLEERKTENQAEIRKRLEDAREELEQGQSYDYLVINDILHKAVEEVTSIIRAEKCRMLRRRNELRHAISIH